MKISLDLVALDMAHKREMKEFSQNAQAIVDDQAREITRLRLELAKANRRIAALAAQNGDLVRERGQRRCQAMLDRIGSSRH